MFLTRTLRYFASSGLVLPIWRARFVPERGKLGGSAGGCSCGGRTRRPALGGRIPSLDLVRCCYVGIYWPFSEVYCLSPFKQYHCVSSQQMPTRIVPWLDGLTIGRFPTQFRIDSFMCFTCCSWLATSVLETFFFGLKNGLQRTLVEIPSGKFT